MQLPRLAVSVAGIVGALLGVAASAHAADWTRTGDLTATQRVFSQAAVLPDGRVLVVGGAVGDAYGPNTYQAPGTFGGLAVRSAELYNPADNSFKSIASGAYDRFGGSAVTLRDGRVLVTAGAGSGGFPAQADLFDPASGTWTRTDYDVESGSNQTVLLLDDGRVFSGGTAPMFQAITLPIGTACCPDQRQRSQIYDPATDQWTRTAPEPAAHDGGTVAKLKDGRVLVTGGVRAAQVLNPGINVWQADYSMTSTDIYNPATDTWTAVAPTHEPRFRCEERAPAGRAAAGGRRLGLVAHAQAASLHPA